MFPVLLFCYLCYMLEAKKHLTATTLVFPLFTKYLNGHLYVTKSGNTMEKLYFVFEVGLFAMQVQELTVESIKTKYGVNLPKDFFFVSE